MAPRRRGNHLDESDHVFLGRMDVPRIEYKTKRKSKENTDMGILHNERKENTTDRREFQSTRNANLRSHITENIPLVVVPVHNDRSLARCAVIRRFYDSGPATLGSDQTKKKRTTRRDAKKPIICNDFHHRIEEKRKSTHHDEKIMQTIGSEWHRRVLGLQIIYVNNEESVRSCSSVCSMSRSISVSWSVINGSTGDAIVLSETGG